MPAQDAAPVSGVFPAGASFHLLEIRVQAIQLLAISRGSRNAPSHTPGHGRYFPGMLLSPSGFPSRSAIRPRNLPSSSSRLSRGYNRAPRGADAANEYVLAVSGGSVDGGSVSCPITEGLLSLAA